MADRVPIEPEGSPPARGGCSPARRGWLKSLVAVFVLFLLVSSDLFVNSVLAGRPGLVDRRAATARGVVAQGVFLVIFFAIALSLIEAGAL